MSDTEIKSSSIHIRVGLDKDNFPAEMEWHTDEQPEKLHQSKAMLLSLFDMESKDTVKIDLWTSEMQVMEMDRFFFQTLRGMADTYYKATRNAKLASAMQQFVQYFGEETEIIPKSADKSI
jgi:gliding motility-associated protein GldC